MYFEGEKWNLLKRITVPSWCKTNTQKGMATRGPHSCRLHTVFEVRSQRSFRFQASIPDNHHSRGILTSRRFATRHGNHQHSKLSPYIHILHIPCHTQLGYIQKPVVPMKGEEKVRGVWKWKVSNAAGTVYTQSQNSEWNQEQHF